MTRSEKSSNITRRELIKTAAAAAIIGSAGLTRAAQSSVQKSVAPATGAYAETLSTPIIARYQVVVAGGGPSGVIAAVAAARSGAKTLLIERYGFLGGNGTAGLMISYNGFRNQHEPSALQTVKGIPAEYIAELNRLGGAKWKTNYAATEHDIDKGDLPYAIGFDPEAAKVAALHILKKEGVEMRLHSWIAAPMLDGSRVTGVIVESKSGRQAIAADIVIDATGDGDVAARAGAPFMSPAATGNRMDMNLMYLTGDHNAHWRRPYAKGDGTNVEDLTRNEIEQRLALWDQIQEDRKKPGNENLHIEQTATGIGVRETRRILGEYVLTEQDAVKGVRFADVIAISSNPMPEYNGHRYFFTHEGFDIPYRTLVPQKIEGLVLTGRCISVEQGPFQSARSMAPAMAVGHASGVAAALAAKTQTPPRKLDPKSVQKLLLSQNAELRMKA